MIRGVCKDDIYHEVKGFDDWDHGLLGSAGTKCSALLDAGQRTNGRHGLKIWVIMALMVEPYCIGMCKNNMYSLDKGYDHRNVGLMGNAKAI